MDQEFRGFKVGAAIMNTTREEQLFAAAAKVGIDDRAHFLQQNCGGDKALRQRLEALLEAHDGPTGFMARESTESEMKVEAMPVDMVAEGQRIGPYKILEKIGEGGCGVVYVAEQSEPIRRRVALKVIKLGMDTKQVVARFEAERQALAMMNHPNIAQVLDAGATEQGRPYFVMELVRGIRVTEYCDQNNLSTKERLELFSKVCQAIQHAHQKGIIHRDIKPSNILVTLHDGVPVPKVIDFGIAKATEGRLTEATVYTQLHQFIGTPAYMSPEQAEMSGLDIDTRCDIYSLGVLLYELLTGTTPFDGKELMASGIEAMRKTIREREPMPASTRIAMLGGEDSTTVAKRRGTTAPALIRGLKGDIDWILMKCLEKDRSRRYATANGLAVEITRHLSNEPVIARPPSTAYRFQKAVRRNKFAFAGAAGVVLALIVVSALFTRERASFRAMLVAEQKAAEERVRHAILIGDQPSTEKALEEATRKGVRKARLHHLRGLHLLTSAQAHLAIPELAAAHALEPESVSTLGLLATASLLGKGWAAYEPLIPKLQEARPVTAEDKLFLGQARSIVGAEAGIPLMEAAIRENDSPLARLILGGARTQVAKDTGNISLIEAALVDIAAAEAWGRHSLPVVMGACETHRVAAGLYRRAGDAQRADREGAAADRASQRLEMFYPNVQALHARLAHLILTGATADALRRSEMWGRDMPWAGFELFSLWVLLVEGQFQKCVDLSQRKTDPLWRMVHFISTMEVSGAGTELKPIVEEFSARRPTNVGDLFGVAAVSYLTGNTNHIEQLTRRFLRDRQGSPQSSVPEKQLPILRFLAAEIDKDELLATEKGAFASCQANHFVGLRYLANGDRRAARTHFETARQSAAEGEIAHILSDFMLKRLEKNPNWPPTITARH